MTTKGPCGKEKEMKKRYRQTGAEVMYGCDERVAELFYQFLSVQLRVFGIASLTFENINLNNDLLVLVHTALLANQQINYFHDSVSSAVTADGERGC